MYGNSDGKFAPFAIKRFLGTRRQQSGGPSPRAEGLCGRGCIRSGWKARPKRLCWI